MVEARVRREWQACALVCWLHSSRVSPPTPAPIPITPHRARGEPENRREGKADGGEESEERRHERGRFEWPTLSASARGCCAARADSFVRKRTNAPMAPTAAPHAALIVPFSRQRSHWVDVRGTTREAETDGAAAAGVAAGVAAAGAALEGVDDMMCKGMEECDCLQRERCKQERMSRGRDAERQKARRLASGF